MRRAAPLAALLADGCAGVQTSLGGQGTSGASFITLFEIFLGVTGAVYVAVIAFLLAALLRRRAVAAEPVPDARHPLLRPALLGWTGFILVGLSGLAVASFLEDRMLAQGGRQNPFTIEVTAKQWWWDIKYQ